MVLRVAARCLFVAVALGIVLCAARGQDRTAPPDPAAGAEAKALRFLSREVPAWYTNNSCFSCHNNGDAARALYAASTLGHSIPDKVIAETTAWISQPDTWDRNKGDPGFSDKRLANIQFSAALLSAIEAGYVKDRRGLAQAARRLARDQGVDGAWEIDSGNVLGSPATYGTHLATAIALQTLRRAALPETNDSVLKAERWLARTTPANILIAASLLLAVGESDTLAGLSTRQTRERCLEVIRKGQTSGGGWGPYGDAPPEPFDTAVVLIALSKLRDRAGVSTSIRRGRAFLAAEQNRDGSWQETTRPAGGESYAQRISTTGWAMLALLMTREVER